MYHFQNNFTGETEWRNSLPEAKKAAKQVTYGYPIRIYLNGVIKAIVQPKANEQPLP